MDGALASDCRACVVQLPRHLFSGYVDYIGEEFGLDGMKAAQGDRFLHEVRVGRYRLGVATFTNGQNKKRLDYPKRKLKHVGFVENLPLNRKGKDSNWFSKHHFSGAFPVKLQGCNKKTLPKILGILNFWLLYMGVSLWPPRPKEKNTKAPQNLLKLLAGR